MMERPQKHNRGDGHCGQIFFIMRFMGGRIPMKRICMLRDLPLNSEEAGTVPVISGSISRTLRRAARGRCG